MTAERRAMAEIVSANSAEEILAAVETFVTETLAPDERWLLLFDGNGSADDVPTELPFSEAILERIRTLETECVIGDTADRRSAVSDPGDDQLGLPPYRSMAFVPVGEHGTVIVGKDQPDALGEDDVRSLSFVAELASVALDRVGDDDRGADAAHQLDEIRSTLSHDMVQPIAIARGNLGIVMQGDDPERLETVDAALERISQLTLELEAIASTGNRTGHANEVDVASVARLAWELCEEPGTYLEVESDRAVEADKNALCHVFENLFRNAIEHGADTITVGVAGDRIYVDDDGPGIDAEVRDRVFERGFSTKDQHTGEGLAIVYDIVQSHGWDVAAAASDAGGARFEIAVG